MPVGHDQHQLPHHQSYIDGLRGIAILMVLVNHVFYEGIGVLNHAHESLHWFYDFILAGNRGVSLFFIVSAFTLYTSSSLRFGRERAPVRNFYIRRIARILPLWWIVVVAYLFVFHRSFSRSLPNLGMYFGFLKYERPKEYLLGEWSIFVEESFYLVFPLLFTRLGSIIRVVWLLLATLAIRSLWTGYAHAVGIPKDYQFIEFFPLAKWYCFAIGIVMARCLPLPGVQACLQKKEVLRVLNWSAFFALYAFVRDREPYCIVALVLVFLASVSEKGIWGKIARNSFLRMLGVRCYSIYLIHGAVLLITSEMRDAFFVSLGLVDSSPEMRFAIWLPIQISINLAIASFTFPFLEQTFIRLGKKWIEHLETRPSKWREASSEAGETSSSFLVRQPSS